MQWSWPFDDTGGLPALLAEYGRLAAQLSDAEPVRGEQLRRQLRELDVVIDRYMADLPTSRL